MTEAPEPQAISLAALERILSGPRIEAYRLDPAETPSMMIGRYRWNIALCMALYPLVQQFEVALRNNLNRAIAAHCKTANWYDLSPSVLTQRERDAVAQAKDELIKEGKPTDSDRMVAQLKFGFWTSLLSREYERQLWPHLLSASFPYIPRRQRTRAFIAERLVKIRRLRNRVSHHEPIFKLDLPLLYNEVEDAVGWLAPALLKLLPVGEHFRDVYARGCATYVVMLS